MVGETFRHGAAPVYARARERGRMLPDGLTYVDSWVDARGLDPCFQLMETDEALLLEEWIAEWRDLVDFEVVPVTSTEAADRSRVGRVTCLAPDVSARATGCSVPAGRPAA